MQNRTKEVPDYYAVLGVKKTADSKAIKQAYRRLALAHHSDKHQGESEDVQTAHKEMFLSVAEAYEVLINPESRKKYDAVNVDTIIETIKNKPRELSNLLKAAKEAGYNFDIDKIIDERGALIHIAAGERNVEALKILIENGANVNVKNYKGDTPLHICSIHGFNEHVDEILKNDPDLQLKNNEGKTVMDVAKNQKIAQSFEEKLNPTGMVNALLELGARGLGIIDNFFGASDKTPNPVPRQDERKHNPRPPKPTYVPEDLSGTTSHVNAKMNETSNPTRKLHEAIKAGDTKQVAILLEQGAEVHKIINGEAAIHVVAKAMNNSSDIVALLIDKLADINQADNNGNTLLHLAVENNNANLVLYLIDNVEGINVNAQNTLGKTASHIASENYLVEDVDVETMNDHDTIYNALQEHKDYIENLEDNQGITPEMNMDEFLSKGQEISEHQIPESHDLEKKERGVKDPLSSQNKQPSIEEVSGGDSQPNNRRGP